MTFTKHSKTSLMELCRLCLGCDGTLLSVAENVDTSESISEKIYSCLLIEILATDEVSQKVCQECLDKVNDFYSFRQVVAASQEQLGRLLASTKTNSASDADSQSSLQEENREVVDDGKNDCFWISEVQMVNDLISKESSLTKTSTDHGYNKVENPLDLRCSNIVKGSGTLKGERTSLKRLSFKGRHVCKDCNKSFSSLRALLKHLNKLHVKTFSCSKCNVSFKNAEQLKVHNWVHREKLTCDKCAYSSFSLSNFKLHVMKHNSEFLVTCEECGKGFYRMSSYEEHRVKKHSHEIVVHKCESCGKAYHSQGYLQQHMKIHLPNYQKKDYQCEMCGKTFLSWKGIRGHMGSAHEGNRYKCDVCFKEVTTLHSLKTHKKIHTGEKSYVCDECGKAFIRMSSLVVHRRIHSGEKPYSCNVCDKSFSQRSTLNVHKRSHTGERPYPCNYCNKRFVTRTLMNSHVKTHQSVTFD